MGTSPLAGRFHLADFGKFVAVFAALLALQFGTGLDRTVVIPWPETVLFVGALAMCAAVLVLKPKMKAVVCSCCGKPAFPFQRGGEAVLCPRCRNATLSPAQRRRLGSRTLVVMVLLLLAGTAVLVWPFSGPIGGWIGTSAWVAALLFAVLLFTTLLVSLVAFLVARQLVWMRRLARPGYALAAARTCAGEAGVESTFGPVSVDAFGMTDPSAIVREQAEAVRARFEALVGETATGERALRVYAFGRREVFLRFLGRAGFNPGHLDGMYVPWAERSIVYSAEVDRHRLSDTDRMLRTLFGYFELEAFSSALEGANWLQVGIANVVACGGDAHELARLNRRMLATLAGGTAFSAAELFGGDSRRLAKWLRGWDDFDNFRRLSQYHAQAWSVTEFLCGSGATAERRARFVAWLQELRRGESPETSFATLFGQGFDGLLDEWRGWVASKRGGRYEVPTSAVREAVCQRLIPAITAPNTKPLDRVLAIRDLGRSRDLGAAQTLVEIVRSGGPDYGREALTSLESLSGLALGSEAGAWEAWCKELPGELVAPPSAS